MLIPQNSKVITLKRLLFPKTIPSASIISRAEDINTTVSKTVIHWNSQTSIEKVSCEMRYKATTNQTWNVSSIYFPFTCK